MRINDKYIYGLLAAVVLCFAACSDFDNDGNRIADAADDAVVLSVSLPGQSAQTRAGSLYTPVISNSSKIDLLIYSIYEVPYKNGTEDLDNATIVPLSSDPTDTQGTRDMTSEPWPVTIRLSLDPAKGYRVVFWAQNEACEAYDTDDLAEIKVSYTSIGGGTEVNWSDYVETRDAFYATAIIKPGETTALKEVVLHRPFAQINIGTTGADYANLIYNTRIKPDYLTINQSKITIEGVANRFNAVSGRAYAEAESPAGGTDGAGNAGDAGDAGGTDDAASEPAQSALLTAVFDWEYLPAWYGSLVPSFNNVIYDHKNDTPRGSNPFVGPKDNEEFLVVRLNYSENAEYLEGYKTEYPTVEFEQKKDADGNPLTDASGNPIPDKTKVKKYLTETFKYLSMCYVLVPADETFTVNGGDKVTGSTVTVKYNFRQLGGSSVDAPIALEEKTLQNVPVSANWRTNILGGLYDNENEDPTSIFNTIPVTISIAPFEDSYFVGKADFLNGSDNGNDGDGGSDSDTSSDQPEEPEEPDNSNL